jgi:hypothetical protein
MPFETPKTVRPEPVEGLSFFLSEEGKGEGFDKLSPNGVFGISDV